METFVLIATFSSILSGAATLFAIYRYIRGWWTGRREEYFGTLYYLAYQKWFVLNLLLILIVGYLLLLHNLPPGSEHHATLAAWLMITFIVTIHLLPLLHNTFSSHRMR